MEVARALPLQEVLVASHGHVVRLDNVEVVSSGVVRQAGVVDQQFALLELQRRTECDVATAAAGSMLTDHFKALIA